MDQTVKAIKPTAITGHDKPDVLQVNDLPTTVPPFMYNLCQNIKMSQALGASAFVKFLVMGFDLLALRMSLNIPMEMTYLLSLIFLIRYRKYPIGILMPMMATVKKTMNRKYYVEYVESLPTVGGFHF
jgi:hypothetical protein